VQRSKRESLDRLLLIIYRCVGGAVKTSKSIKTSLRRLLTGGRRSSDHAHQDERSHVNSGYGHNGGQDHVTKDHVGSDVRVRHVEQDHLISHHVTTDHAHKTHVTSNHASSGSSTNNVTLCNAQNGGPANVQPSISDHVTSDDHVVTYHAHHSGRDHVTLGHVTTDHAHKDHVTKERMSSKHTIEPSPEVSQPQQPGLPGHVGSIPAEVVLHESPSWLNV